MRKNVNFFTLYEVDKQIVATGTCDVSICINGVQITFQDVLFCSELNMIIVFVSSVVDKGLSVVFNSKAAAIMRKDQACYCEL